MEPLWVDKHRPRTLDRLSYHTEINQVLTQLAETSDFPHIILYGPQGSGKKTRAYAFLAKIFGDHVFKIRQQQRILKPENTSTTIEFSIFTSNHHIQMTPSDNEHNDRHIVQNVVKEIAENTNVQSKSKKAFKVLIINQADKLTKDAQGGLRRTMEKYMKNCRMILICNSVHRLINPIRSRCLNLRIPAPSTKIITDVLAQIGRLQSTSLYNNNFTPQIYSKLANNCNRNLRLAIIQLQATKYTKNAQGMIAPYKKEIRDISDMIVKEQTPVQLKRIRDKFYDLLVNCIDGQTILKQLLEQILKHKQLQLRQQVIKQMIHQASEHQKTLLCGSKAIYHLQSFAANAMEQVVISKSFKMMIEQ